MVTGIVAHGQHSDLERECGGPCPPDRQGDVDHGERLARTSTALTFVSVAAVGTGVVLLLLGRGDGDDTAVTASAGATRDGAAFSVSVRY